MKRLYTLMLMLAMVAGLYSQELDSLKSIMNIEDEPEQTEQENRTFTPVIVDDDGEEVRVRIMDREIVRVIESGDSTMVKVGEKGILEVIDQRDSTSIRVGDKEIRIVERGGETDIWLEDVNKEHKIKNPKFRGHWAGVEWGLNNFLDDQQSMARSASEWYMDLNTGRSWNLNVNFAQYSIGFGTSHFGLLTGMGLEFNNYFFDNENTILEEDDYVIGDSLFGNVAKSKLTTTFLRVPVILEVQFPNTIRAKRVFLSAGIVAGLKLGSHTKVVTKDNGKNKDKKRDDFNINPFRYGVTTRIGFGNVCIYGDYYFTKMFVDQKGPDLHPFNVGLALNF